MTASFEEARRGGGKESKGRKRGKEKRVELGKGSVSTKGGNHAEQTAGQTGERRERGTSESVQTSHHQAFSYSVSASRRVRTCQRLWGGQGSRSSSKKLRQPPAERVARAVRSHGAESRERGIEEEKERGRKRQSETRHSLSKFSRHLPPRDTVHDSTLRVCTQ